MAPENQKTNIRQSRQAYDSAPHFCDSLPDILRQPSGKQKIRYVSASANAPFLCPGPETRLDKVLLAVRASTISDTCASELLSCTHDKPKNPGSQDPFLLIGFIHKNN